MMSCEEAKAALVERTFGEPDETAETRLNEHLLGCDPCREEESRLLRLFDLVREEDAEPGEELRRGIRAALPKPLPAPLGMLRRPVPAYVVIAAGLLGALLVAVLPRVLDRSTRLSPPENRPAGVPLDREPPGFTVAGSYVTHVSPTARMVPGRDSAGARAPVRSDSL